MALTAVLENEGLRPTSRGGHIAPYSAVIAQLDPPMGAILRPFDRMRRTRNRSEYPSFTTPDLTPDNVRADLPVAESIVEVCGGVLDEMSPYTRSWPTRSCGRGWASSTSMRLP
jgi:hypothetical protein